MKKQILAITAISLSLTGCGTATFQKVSDNIYNVEYVENEAVSGPGLVIAKMNEKSMELCPDGYDKLIDRTFKKGTAPAHLWKIQCLKGDENASNQK